MARNGRETLSFTYNLRNRPVTVTVTVTRAGTSPTQTSRYAFNALEQMVQRSTNAPGGPAGTVHYVYGLDGALLAEADGATGATLRDYIWLPVDDVSPAADNDNEEGTQTPPLPLGLVTGVNTPAPGLLMVHADHLGRPLRLTETARVTVRFVLFDQGRTNPSNGLGLSLVSGVMKLHKGRLALEDNGPGLRARLVLPAWQDG